MTENMTTQTPPPTEYSHWPRVYTAVVIVTAAVIGALALFSELFSS